MTVIHSVVSQSGTSSGSERIVRDGSCGNDSLPSPLSIPSTSPSPSPTPDHQSNQSVSCSTSLAASSITASLSDEYSSTRHRHVKKARKLACALKMLKCSSRASKNDGFESYSDFDHSSLGTSQKQMKRMEAEVVPPKSHDLFDLRVSEWDTDGIDGVNNMKEADKEHTNKSTSTDTTTSFATEDPEWEPVFDDRTAVTPSSTLTDSEINDIKDDGIFERNGAFEVRRQYNGDMFPLENFDEEEAQFNWKPWPKEVAEKSKDRTSDEVSFILDDLEDCYQVLSSNKAERRTPSPTARFASPLPLAPSSLDMPVGSYARGVEPDELEQNERDTPCLFDNDSHSESDEDQEPSPKTFSPERSTSGEFPSPPRDEIYSTFNNFLVSEMIDLAPVDECDEEDQSSDDEEDEAEQNFLKHKHDSSSTLSVAASMPSSHVSASTIKISNTARGRKRFKTGPTRSQADLDALLSGSRSDDLVGGRGKQPSILASLRNMRVSVPERRTIEAEQGLILNSFGGRRGGVARRQQPDCKTAPSFFWRSNPTTAAAGH